MARLLVEIKSENMQSIAEVGGHARTRSIVVLPLIFCKIQEKGKPLGNRRDTKRWQSGIDFSQLRLYFEFSRDFSRISSRGPHERPCQRPSSMAFGLCVKGSNAGACPL